MATKKHDKDEEAVEKNIERDEVMSLLKCDFSQEELLEISRDMTQKMYAREIKQGELDSIKKQYNGEISTLDEEIKTKQRHVHDGYEFRAIPCQVERNYNTKTYTLTRLDSGEVVESRPLRLSELQRKMFTDTGEPGAAAAAEA